MPLVGPTDGAVLWTVSGVRSASMTVFAVSSIQKPKCSSTVDELLPLGVSTMTTLLVRQLR